MNILVINCSPVKNGATAEIVKLVSEHVNDGNNVRTLCIDDYEVNYCKGCRRCHETAECFQEDDVKKIMGQYEWADTRTTRNYFKWEERIHDCFKNRFRYAGM